MEPRKLKTVEDLLLCPDERVELIGGEIVRRPMARSEHGLAQGSTRAELSPFTRPSGPNGWWIITEVSVAYETFQCPVHVGGEESDAAGRVHGEAPGSCGSAGGWSGDALGLHTTGWDWAASQKPQPEAEIRSPWAAWCRSCDGNWDRQRPASDWEALDSALPLGLACRRRRPDRQTTLADFFIDAWARMLVVTLVARDTGRLRIHQPRNTSTAMPPAACFRRSSLVQNSSQP